MIEVDKNFAKDKYVSAKEYIPDTNRVVIVYTDYEHLLADYSLGYYAENWYDIDTGIPISPDYWREIPKIK